MKIIMLGAPGAGKGTQAIMIGEHYALPHISTGDIFRANIKNGTALGQKAKSYMDQGLLVPDELTCDLVMDRIQQDDCKNGFILDGFPRTLPQAEVLDKLLDKKGIVLDAAIEIQVPDEIIMERILGRYACMKCGQGYHDRYLKPKVYGVCDNCGGTEFYRRIDDNRTTVHNRLVNYRALTYPTIPYFEQKGWLLCVDGTGSIDAVAKKIENLLAVVREK